MADFYKRDELLADKAEFEKQLAALNSQQTELAEQITYVEDQIASIDSVLGYIEADYPEITALDDIENFVLTSGVNSGILIWDAVANADRYIVERSLTSDFYIKEEVYNDVTNSFTNTDLTPGTTYYYRVKAQGEGYADSAWASASLLILEQLQTPGTFLLVAETGSVTGNWDDVIKPNGEAVDGYKVYRNEEDDFSTATEVDDVAVSNFTDNTVVNGTEYWYYIVAYSDGYVNSEPAETDSVTPTA